MRFQFHLATFGLALASCAAQANADTIDFINDPITITVKIKPASGIKGIDTVTVQASADEANVALNGTIRTAGGVIQFNFDASMTNGTGLGTLSDPTGASAGTWRGPNGTNTLDITIGGQTVTGITASGQYTVPGTPEPLLSRCAAGAYSASSLLGDCGNEPGHEQPAANG
jgi:hypothetical protein